MFEHDEQESKSFSAKLQPHSTVKLSPLLSQLMSVATSTLELSFLTELKQIYPDINSSVDYKAPCWSSPVLLNEAACLQLQTRTHCVSGHTPSKPNQKDVYVRVRHTIGSLTFRFATGTWSRRCPLSSASQRFVPGRGTHVWSDLLKSDGQSLPGTCRCTSSRI